MTETYRQKKARKRLEAEDRQAEYDSLTTREKHTRAIQRGDYNTREARRLLDQLVKEKSK